MVAYSKGLNDLMILFVKTITKIMFNRKDFLTTNGIYWITLKPGTCTKKNDDTKCRFVYKLWNTVIWAMGYVTSVV